MIVFLKVLMFVPWIAIAVFIVLAVVFAIQAKPKKGQPVEENHKAAKKKSNIFSTISVFAIILGIVISVVLNSYISKLELKKYMEEGLFNNGGTSLSDIVEDFKESISDDE